MRDAVERVRRVAGAVHEQPGQGGRDGIDEERKLRVQRLGLLIAERDELTDLLPVVAQMDRHDHQIAAARLFRLPARQRGGARIQTVADERNSTREYPSCSTTCTTADQA